MTDTATIPAPSYTPAELDHFARTPRFCSPIPDGTDLEAAHRGAALQRLPMTPQGETVAGVLEARRENERPLYPQVAVQIGRRSTKTTAIQNVLLGRCLTRPGYSVVSTAQDGTRASQFLRDVMDLIEQHALEILEELTEAALEGWDGTGRPPEPSMKDALAQLGIRQLYYSQQREFIRFANGSKWRMAKPDPSGLRGGAADVIWFDEAGELDPAESPALLAGALPMMDTRPHGQIIVSGTPGLARAGMFWAELEAAREAPQRRGLVDYSADDWCDPTDEAVWHQHHPGLASGLTSLEVLRERFAGLDLDKFMAEYLCIWPADSKVSALDQAAYAAGVFDALEAPPAAHWGIGFDVAPDGTEAAVAVAWKDAAGDPWVQIMRYRRGGSGWMPDYLARAITAHRTVPVGYDSIGENIRVAQELESRPRVHRRSLHRLRLAEVGAATAEFARATDAMALRHAHHPGLDKAVSNATWRMANDTRLFARKGGQITPLMACVHALAAIQAAPARASSGAVPAPILG